MIFDQFCGLVERHFPEFRKYCDDAKIFYFDAAPHEFLPKGPEAQPQDESLFFLPFPVVAVEDRASCVILIDSKPKQTGLVESKRYFIEIMSAKPNKAAFGDTDFSSEYLQNMPAGSLYVAAGQIDSLIPRGERYQVEANLFRVCMANKKAVLADFGDPHLSMNMDDEAKSGGIVNAIAALEEMILISNTKDHFVLETAPVLQKERRGEAAKKILRSHERPTYTLLKAAEIRKQLGIEAPKPGGERRSPVPHERRRHLRHLRAGEGSRWKEDKVIMVDASWIGDSERIIGNKVYKVRLDI